MAEMEITSMGPDEFGVQVREGEVRTSHRVKVPAGLLDDLQLADEDAEIVVRESFEFLLEREPASSILPEFSLNEISKYFPEYSEELSRRLS